MNKTKTILLERVNEKGIVEIIMNYKSDLESVEYFIIQLIDNIIREVIDIQSE